MHTIFNCGIIMQTIKKMKPRVSIVSAMMIIAICMPIAASSKDAKLPLLEACANALHADLRTMSDTIYYEIHIIEITPKKIVFETNNELKEILRTKIFRIATESQVCSDTGLTVAENAALESARDYMADYLDYVLQLDYTRNYGHILEITESHIKIEQESAIHTIAINQVLSYRANRSEKKLHNRALPPHWLRRWGIIQDERWHLLEGIIGISSPLNIFPQITIGMQTNSRWPVYAGVRGGASGNLITAGWYYAQAQFYLGVNLFELDYWRVSAVAGYLYRNHFMNTPISCNCAVDSPGYFADFTTVTFNQKNFYAGIALKFRNLYFEFGWEIHDYFSSELSGPKRIIGQVSAENQKRIDDSLSNAQQFAEGVGGYSRLYFSAGFSLSFF
ncbi:MAG: hypothetical protein U1F16_07210 [Turneriella sp.]